MRSSTLINHTSHAIHRAKSLRYSRTRFEPVLKSALDLAPAAAVEEIRVPWERNTCEMNNKTEREEYVIAGLCRFLSLVEGRKVTIVRRPDREEGGGCDAIIDRPGKAQAVEHTRLDSFKGQRADDAVFNQVIVPLETDGEIPRQFPDSYVEIIVPVRAVPRGMPRTELRKRLMEGVIRGIASTPLDGKVRFVQVEGVPFPVGISRHRVRQNPACIVMRSVPEDQARELEEVLSETLKQKDLQLVSYARDGYEPALVIDNDDVMLLDRHSVGDAYQAAVAKKPVVHIKDVFVADTGHGEMWFYPLRLAGVDYPNLPEFDEFVEIQRVDRVRRRGS